MYARQIPSSSLPPSRIGTSSAVASRSRSITPLGRVVPEHGRHRRDPYYNGRAARRGAVRRCHFFTTIEHGRQRSMALPRDALVVVAAALRCHAAAAAAQADLPLQVVKPFALGVRVRIHFVDGTVHDERSRRRVHTIRLTVAREVGSGTGARHVDGFAQCWDRFNKVLAVVRHS